MSAPGAGQPGLPRPPATRVAQCKLRHGQGLDIVADVHLMHAARYHRPARGEVPLSDTRRLTVCAARRAAGSGGLRSGAPTRISISASRGLALTPPSEQDRTRHVSQRRWSDARATPRRRWARPACADAPEWTAGPGRGAHRATLPVAGHSGPQVGLASRSRARPTRGDRRAWDAVLARGQTQVTVEAETRVRDLQELERRRSLKHQDWAGGEAVPRSSPRGPARPRAATQRSFCHSRPRPRGDRRGPGHGHRILPRRAAAVTRRGRGRAPIVPARRTASPARHPSSAGPGSHEGHRTPWALSGTSRRLGPTPARDDRRRGCHAGSEGYSR